MSWQPDAPEPWSHRGEWHGLDVASNDAREVVVHGVENYEALNEWLRELFYHSRLRLKDPPDIEAWCRRIERYYSDEITDAMRAACIEARKFAGCDDDG